MMVHVRFAPKGTNQQSLHPQWDSQGGRLATRWADRVLKILKALRVTNRTEAVIAVNELGWKLPTARNR